LVLIMTSLGAYCGTSVKHTIFEFYVTGKNNRVKTLNNKQSCAVPGASPDNRIRRNICDLCGRPAARRRRRPQPAAFTHHRGAAAHDGGRPSKGGHKNWWRPDRSASAIALPGLWYSGFLMAYPWSRAPEAASGVIHQILKGSFTKSLSRRLYEAVNQLFTKYLAESSDGGTGHNGFSAPPLDS
jgi:hypothetical protein